MLRAISLLAVGAAAGGAAMYLVADSQRAASRPDTAVPALLTRVAALVTSSESVGAVEHALTLPDHLAAYRSAAEESDIERLRELVERAAREPRSPASDLQMDAWLARLSELDAAYAALLARAAGLPERFVVHTFQWWAEVDPERALAELVEIERAVTRRAVALGLLDVIGDDVSGIERVALALPHVDGAMFRMEAVAKVASYDLPAAIQAALAMLDGNVLGRAITHIAAAAARRDPRDALMYAVLLPDDLARQYRSTLGLEWARVDAEGLLAYIESEGNVPQELLGGLPALVASAPGRVLEVVDGLTGQSAMSVRRMVYAGIAELDPVAMIARLDELPAGMERDQLVQVIASGYARQDADAALRWVRQLDPPSQNAHSAVLMQIAQTDPDRAMDLILEESSGSGVAGLETRMMMSAVSFALASNTDQVGRIADRLLASDAGQADNALRSVLGSWIQRDPDATMRWLLDNGASIDVAVANGVAGSFAARDPVAAATYLDQIPAELRAGWMAQVAGAYASHDADGALSWLAQYQGQDGYDAALRQAITRLALSGNDPQMAASLVARAGSEVQLGTAPLVASRWASQDPQAAASWAQSLGSERARAAAVGAVASTLASTDQAAARRLALGLPRGAARDQALTSLMTAETLAAGGAGGPAQSLLDAFSSVRARELGVAQLATAVATRDRDAAMSLLDGHVTDPALRRTTEERIETAGQQALVGSGSSIISDSGGVIILR